MPVTEQIVRDALSAIPHALARKRPMSLADIAAGANVTLTAFPGITVDGAASLLATGAQESAWFTTTTEASRETLRYDPFRGRGFCQVTWRENYAAFGRWCRDRGLVDNPDIFVRTPTLLADRRWAWLTVAWYFARHDLIGRYGNRGDFLAVSQAVNGGPKAVGRRNRDGSTWHPHGWADRQKIYAAFRRHGAALLPGPQVGPTLAPGSTGPVVGRLIDWANTSFVKGYGMPPILKLDPPLYGPGCTAFMREFQRRVGFVGRDIDGVLGPMTWPHAIRHGLRP